MKKVAIVGALALFLTLGFTTATQAAPITLFLNTAPNANGSTAWPAFRDASYAALYAGTSVNQANSSNPANIGTLNYEPADCFVYSFGDLGKRLHAFYYVPGYTTASLAAAGFQVSIEYEWAGEWYNPYEDYGWGKWVTPSGWTNYDGNKDGYVDGVMGSMGNGLWGAYHHNVDTPEARAALAADMMDADRYLGNTRFLARMNVDGRLVTSELVATHTPVPEPATLSMLGLGLVGIARAARRRR